MKDVDLSVLETIVAKMRELGIRKFAVGDIEVELDTAPMAPAIQRRQEFNLADALARGPVQYVGP